MFIVVSYSDDWGFENRTFETHREAFEHMAGSIKQDYNGFDMTEYYPLDNADERYSYGDVIVCFGSNWCNCYNNKKDYSDHWIIIEV